MTARTERSLLESRPCGLDPLLGGLHHAYARAV